MLPITIRDTELYDEGRHRFITVKGQTLQLEHSLLSISKWESKWKVPFLSPRPKSQEETIDYVRCMTINSGVDPYLYQCITAEDIIKIQAYIDDPMSASRFRGDGPGGKGRATPRPMSSERIYAKMVEHGIPFECQKWHLNRLLALIRMCDTSGGKMNRNSSKDYMQNLNKARRSKYHSKG